MPLPGADFRFQRVGWVDGGGALSPSTVSSSGPERLQLHHDRVHGGFLSDIIDFMERMGGDAQLSRASADELADVLSATDLAPEVQSALIAGDAGQLGTLLGTKPMCMLVAPPGPPGTERTPMRPAVPPPPPDDAEEEQEIKDISRYALANESPQQWLETSQA